MVALVSAKSLQKRLRAAAEIDAHRGDELRQRFVSVWRQHEIEISLSAPQCRLEIRVLERSRSGRHKFKLGGMRVAWGRGSEVANC